MGHELRLVAKFAGEWLDGSDNDVRQRCRGGHVDESRRSIGPVTLPNLSNFQNLINFTSVVMLT